MNRSRERFIDLLTVWQQTKNKKLERSLKDQEKEELTSEDLKSYLPDTENEIDGDMTKPRGDDELQFGSIYFQETCEGKFPIKNKILRMELK